MSVRRPPLTDPRAQALVRAASRSRSSGLTRRGLLLGALGTAGAGAVLAACGAPAKGSGAGSGTAGLVRWANWSYYLDTDESGTTHPTLEEFTARTGIRAEYTEAIEDNDTFWDSISGTLEAGKDIGYDIVTLTNYKAAQMIEEGFAEELDRSRIPNAANLVEELSLVDFDLGRTHSLTWQSGFAGLAWAKDQVPRGLHTLSDLWAPELAGRVEVLSEMRDTMGLILLDLGVDPGGSWGDTEFYMALEVLRDKIDTGHVRKVSGASYTDGLVAGDTVAVIGWSGDITALNYENADRFEFALPEAGGTLWSDNLLIPTGSPHKADAEDLINFYYDPEVAAQVAAWVNYITPVQGAQEAMVAIDPELAQDPMIFPDEATLRQAHVFRTLAPDEDARFTAEFAAVIGG
ncbi:polyamine ABC transporter substrate-binding protein [Cellulomonas soli]|uniref:ABC transporter substrate-binding protein n=1 Tax=Cellulomonas soli TaxID=931535 RepID=A0A512PBE3_9CELL|nr:spermidine/putrescine ABC transporter substrate-binding protein [Cellulomonas soli]NYI61052.1 spermidine/putrescine transport system substrate-binding protein [Cellulomonas soli]GEP68531.1 ABC transporter substrate-binding protein [Cellulomonas soli]